MINQIRSEWLKLSRRPLTWVVLLIFLAQMVLTLSLMFLMVGLSNGIWSISAQDLLKPEQLAEFQKQISFPGIFGEVFGQINGLGGFFAVILAAASFGSEYSWGTMRLQLARQPERGRYITAKGITLLLTLLVGMVAALLVGTLCALLYGLALGNVGSVSARDLLLLPVGMGRALLILLPYLMFTLAVSALGRSVVAGTAGGILFMVADAGVGAPAALVATMNNPVVTFIYNLLIQQNINTLVMQNRLMYGLDPSITMTLLAPQMPSQLQAMLVVLVYSLVFSGYTWFLVTRRDVGGAA